MPKCAKFAGILSTTRDASSDSPVSSSKYSSAIFARTLPSKPLSNAADPTWSDAVFQKDNSPAPNTAGCEASICSASEVPERGIPQKKLGPYHQFDVPLARSSHSRS